MSRPNFDRLVTPPRAVPLGLRVAALFGGGDGFPILAWGMLLFTTPVLWGVAVKAEVLAPIVLGASAARTEGRVTASYKEASRNPYSWVDYSYQVPAGPLLTGRSWVTGSPPGVGAEVQVEYVPSRPRFSRIVGMRRVRFEAGAIAAILFPAFASVLVVLSLSPGRSMLRLLREGRVGEELRGERRVTLLYLPGVSGTTTAVDALPEVVTVDERGMLAAGTGFRWAVLALPLLVIIVNGACAVNHLR